MEKCRRKNQSLFARDIKRPLDVEESASFKEEKIRGNRMKIKETRTAYGLTQKELVELIGQSGVKLDKPAYSKIENRRGIADGRAASGDVPSHGMQAA